MTTNHSNAIKISLTSNSLFDSFKVAFSTYSNSLSDQLLSKVFQELQIGTYPIDELNKLLVPIEKPSNESNVLYQEYIDFIAIFRRYVRKRVPFERKEDGRFNRIASPPLSAYKYLGSDKIDGITEDADSYAFLLS